jgi:hypothetical protein
MEQFHMNHRITNEGRSEEATDLKNQIGNNSTEMNPLSWSRSKTRFVQMAA